MMFKLPGSYGPSNLLRMGSYVMVKKARIKETCMELSIQVAPTPLKGLVSSSCTGLPKTGATKQNAPRAISKYLLLRHYSL